MTFQQAYIAKIARPCQKACAGTGLFPSVMIAQAALESGYGQSELSSKYNNHFGIKADKSWNGPSVTLNTPEFINGVYKMLKGNFRVYSRPSDSFKDRIKFLKENPRYAKYGVFTAKTPQQQTQALENAGYATSPQYNETLDSIIAKYNLQQYDRKPAMAGINLWVGIILILIAIANYKKLLK